MIVYIMSAHDENVSCVDHSAKHVFSTRKPYYMLIAFTETLMLLCLRHRTEKPQDRGFAGTGSDPPSAEPPHGSAAARPVRNGTRIQGQNSAGLTTKFKLRMRADWSVMIYITMDSLLLVQCLRYSYNTDAAATIAILIKHRRFCPALYSYSFAQLYNPVFAYVHCRSQTSLKWPDNRAELEGNLHFRGWTDFGAGLQFISPLEAIKDVGLMVKTSQTGPYAFQVRSLWVACSRTVMLPSAFTVCSRMARLVYPILLPSDNWISLTGYSRPGTSKLIKSIYQ